LKRGRSRNTPPAVTIRLEIPGRARLTLDYLLLDMNGTLTKHGALLDGVEERVRRLRDQLEVRLLSADTFGTLDEITARLGVTAARAAGGEVKRRVVASLDARRCVAIGNGANDAGMVAEAALGIAVIGPEGAAGSLLAAADLVTHSITDALDLLLEPRALAASLRA
jgi:P-type E1-E2 ATPase